MELHDARCLVAGATGELGTRIARRLAGAGASLGLAGRDAAALERLGGELGAPTARFDASAPESVRPAVDSLAAALGGLDVAIVLPGVAAFGPATELEPDTVAELFAVNAFAPIALLSAAIGHLDAGGAVVGVSAIVAEHPTAGVAHYSAAKAALSAYLAALRHEQRRARINVIDVRPPHLATGFSERPLAGSAPRLPDPIDPDEIVEALVAAIRDDRREVAWDLRARALAVS